VASFLDTRGESQQRSGEKTYPAGLLLGFSLDPKDSFPF
jgi:hypothetical protein